MSAFIIHVSTDVKSNGKSYKTKLVKMLMEGNLL